MMTISRTEPVATDEDFASRAEAVHEPQPDPHAAAGSGWAGLAHVDRRAWAAVGVIAAVGAVIGGAAGAGVLESPLVPLVLLAAMAVAAGRTAWSWLAGPSRRARARDSLLGRVEEYGGGVYGTGAAMTLLVLSAASFRDEWAAASGPMDFLRGMTLDFWIGFSADSIHNAILAGMWPLHWYSDHGLAVALAVCAAAWAGDALADRWRGVEAPEADASAAAEGAHAAGAGTG